MNSVKVASFDTFASGKTRGHVGLPSEVSNPIFSQTLVDELSQLTRHQICDIEANGYRTAIVNVGDRWWTLQQHGLRIELFGFENDPPLPQPVYEFLEPIHETVLFLPWQSYLSDKEHAVTLALGTFDDFRPDGVFFSQHPAELGIELNQRHNQPVNKAAYDKLEQNHWK